MSAGSLRGVKVDGIPFNPAGDADVSLNPRIEKEPIPHAGGNMMKRTFGPGSVEAVKLTLTPSEYDILKGLSDGSGDISLSYEMADGSSFKSNGEVMVGPYTNQDSACEITLLSSTGEWEAFTES